MRAGGVLPGDSAWLTISTAGPTAARCPGTGSASAPPLAPATRRPSRRPASTRRPRGHLRAAVTHAHPRQEGAHARRHRRAPVRRREGLRGRPVRRGSPHAHRGRRRPEEGLHARNARPIGIKGWLLGELPGPITVRGDPSPIRKYVLGTTGHDGVTAVIITAARSPRARSGRRGWTPGSPQPHRPVLAGGRGRAPPRGPGPVRQRKASRPAARSRARR